MQTAIAKGKLATRNKAKLAHNKAKIAHVKHHARARSLGGKKRRLRAAEHRRMALAALSAPAPQSWSAPEAGGSSDVASQTGSSKRRPGTPPRDQRMPIPHDRTGLGAASGFAPGGGTSFWVFAAVLIPFALSVPMGTRGQRSSAIRRLASVVLRPERPG